MISRRILVLAAVGAILATLIYLQVRTWSRFDWGTFAQVTRKIEPSNIIVAVGIVYLTYILRAVRWKIFLRPVRRARLSGLIPPHFIGFAGLALLGRPGELVRPYLIAKKEKLQVSSQIAVWAVERVFDVGAFAVLMAIDVFVFVDRFHLDRHIRLRIQIGGSMLIGLVAAAGLAIWAIRRNCQGVAAWLERRLSPFSRRFAHSLCQKVQAFGEGLHTIQDRSALAQVIGISLAIWWLIALSYREILHAYPALPAASALTHQVALHFIDIPHVLLLIGASMIGSLLQLPAVGGGSQLATISVLSSPAIFNLPIELAVSAGMMLWLVTFVSCVPVGLLFARQEHVSLRRLTQESQQPEEATATKVL
jgi:hypothetical protein